MSVTPRPILKRASSHPPCEQYHPPMSLRSRDPHPNVHFPPNPSLTRTFSAYSSTAYDRSPIVVSPNTCALPERGCPGRTYVLDESSTPKHTPKHRSPMAGHLHPRALSRRSKRAEYIDGSDEAESSGALPKLIPDCTSSSSSESDESDSSPPAIHHQPQSYIFTGSPVPPSKYSRTLHGLVIHESQTQCDTLAFLPHPPSPPDARRSSSASKSRRSLRDVTVVEEDTAYHETKFRLSRSSYSSLTKPMSCLSVEEDLGCLAGF